MFPWLPLCFGGFPRLFSFLLHSHAQVTLVPPIRRCLVTRVAVECAQKQRPTLIVVRIGSGADTGTPGYHLTVEG